MNEAAEKPVDGVVETPFAEIKPEDRPKKDCANALRDYVAGSVSRSDTVDRLKFNGIDDETADEWVDNVDAAMGSEDPHYIVLVFTPELTFAIHDTSNDANVGRVELTP